MREERCTLAEAYDLTQRAEELLLVANWFEEDGFHEVSRDIRADVRDAYRQCGEPGVKVKPGSKAWRDQRAFRVARAIEHREKEGLASPQGYDAYPEWKRLGHTLGKREGGSKVSPGENPFAAIGVVLSMIIIDKFKGSRRKFRRFLRGLANRLERKPTLHDILMEMEADL